MIIGGFIFTYFWGIIGVLVASLLSNIYRSIDLLFYIPKNVTKLSPKSTAYRILRLFVALIIIQVCSGAFELNDLNYLAWAKHTLLVTLIAIFIVLIFGFVPEKDVTLRAAKRIGGLIKK